MTGAPFWAGPHTCLVAVPCPCRGQQSPQTRECAAGCGAVVAIQPGHRPRKFCSAACKQADYRRRKGQVWGGGSARHEGRAIAGTSTGLPWP